MKTKLTLTALLCTLLFGIMYVSHTSAQITLPLQVAPARQEIVIDPGEKGAFNVRFFNLSEEPLSGIIRVADFIVEDSQGSPRILDGTQQASPKYSAASWITLPYDRLTIPANDKISIQARFTVPEQARPGGRYIALYFEPTNTLPSAVNENEEATGIAPRIASLVYIRVSGPITESALISRLYAKSFYEYGPITLQSEIVNRGDYHIRPRGMITISNMFGNIVDEQKIKESNIFPDASRSYENTLGYKWMLGRYKIDLTASYGEQGKAVSRTIYVYTFPWRVALAILLALLIIILLTKHFYKTLVAKQKDLNQELQFERDEIENLKEQLRDKS